MPMDGKFFHGLTGTHGPTWASAVPRVWSESRRKANPNSRNRRLSSNEINQSGSDG
jgi:hypothetical protein